MFMSWLVRRADMSLWMKDKNAQDDNPYLRLLHVLPYYSRLPFCKTITTWARMYNLTLTHACLRTIVQCITTGFWSKVKLALLSLAERIQYDTKLSSIAQPPQCKPTLNYGALPHCRVSDSMFSQSSLTSGCTTVGLSKSKSVLH